MNALTPYLTFNGNARAAMEFYKECLGGDMFMQTFGESPMGADMPEGDKNLVMHASVTNGALVIMASDCRPGEPAVIGNNVSLSITGTSKDQLTDVFNKISAGGHTTMPLQDTFWGAYFGMCTDKFGINWMFNFDYEQQG